MPHQNHAVHILQQDDDGYAEAVIDELSNIVKRLKRDAKKKNAQIEAFKKQLHAQKKG